MPAVAITDEQRAEIDATLALERDRLERSYAATNYVNSLAPADRAQYQWGGGLQVYYRSSEDEGDGAG